MEIDNQLKTPLTNDEKRAIQRIAEIAANGWPVWGTTVSVTGIQLVESTLGGNTRELEMSFGGTGGSILVVPRGALIDAVANLKKGEL